jgi:peroxidase
MEKQTRSMLALVAVSLLVAMLPSSQAAYGGDGLSKDYYSSSCPGLLSFVREEVTRKKNETVVTIPAVLRLFFHDCFVNVSSIANPESVVRAFLALLAKSFICGSV